MTARLMAQQEVEREARNAANLRAWHVAAFGPVAGPLMLNGAHNIPLTASEIRYRNARGPDIGGKL